MHTPLGGRVIHQLHDGVDGNLIAANQPAVLANVKSEMSSTFPGVVRLGLTCTRRAERFGRIRFGRRHANDRFRGVRTPPLELLGWRRRGLRENAENRGPSLGTRPLRERGRRGAPYATQSTVMAVPE